MATEETLAQQIEYNADAIDVLFDTVGRSNTCIVADVPRAAFTIRQRVFEECSKVVVVTDLSLSGLRDTMRLMTGIEETAPGKPIYVVVNRIGGKSQAMTPGDFQKALDHKVNFTIPEDSKSFTLAANNGKPVVQISANNPASKAFRKIAEGLADMASDSPGGSQKTGWRRFFKKK